MAKVGFVFENFVSKLLDKCLIRYRTENQIKGELGSHINGVDHFLTLGDYSIFIQEKWEENNGTQRCCSQFMLACDEIIKESSLSRDKCRYLWLSKRPPSTNAKKYLDSNCAIINGNEDIILSELLKYLIDIGIDKSPSSEEMNDLNKSFLKELMEIKAKIPFKKIKIINPPKSPTFSEKIYELKDSLSLNFGFENPSLEYDGGNSYYQPGIIPYGGYEVHYVLVEQLKVTFEKEDTNNLDFFITCGNQQKFSVTPCKGNYYKTSSSPTKFDAFTGQLRITFPSLRNNNITSIQIKLKVLKKRKTNKDIKEDLKIERLKKMFSPEAIRFA